MWNRDSLALEPDEQGYPFFENDETSVIGNTNTVICVFVLLIGLIKNQAFFAF